MCQAQKKGRNLARINSNNIQMNNLWSNSPMHKYLTDYAERMASERWDLSHCRKCVQVSNDTYWVYKPDVSESEKDFAL